MSARRSGAGRGLLGEEEEARRGDGHSKETEGDAYSARLGMAFAGFADESGAHITAVAVFNRAK